jgi:hypothetical protein
MPKPIAKKRHLKKVLDRWENEGGTVPDVPANPPPSVLPDLQTDKDDKPSADRDANTTES